MVCGVLQQIKSIHHSSFLYENSDFPTFYPATFSSHVCHQGGYRFGSPVLLCMAVVHFFENLRLWVNILWMGVYVLKKRSRPWRIGVNLHLTGKFGMYCSVYVFLFVCLFSLVSIVT